MNNVNKNINNKAKVVPILFSRKDECCGCTACYAICSQGAISMKSDDEGFEYPIIDPVKCVKCYMCLRVCPIKESKRLFGGKKN